MMPLYCYQYIWIEDYNYVPLFQDIVIERSERKPKEKYKQHKQNFLKHIEPLKD
jgi:hypothetical protein